MRAHDCNVTPTNDAFTLVRACHTMSNAYALLSMGDGTSLTPIHPNSFIIVIVVLVQVGLVRDGAAVQPLRRKGRTCYTAEAM